MAIKNPTTIDLLNDTKKKLIKYGWTNVAAAVDIHGNSIDPTRQEAVAYSLGGAVVSLARDSISSPTIDCILLACNRRGFLTIMGFERNCSSTKEVLLLVDEAIEIWEEKKKKPKATAKFVNKEPKGKELKVKEIRVKK